MKIFKYDSSLPWAMKFSVILLLIIPRELFLRRSNLISNSILLQTLPGKKKEKGYNTQQ